MRAEMERLKEREKRQKVGGELMKSRTSYLAGTSMQAAVVLCPRSYQCSTSCWRV